MTPLLAESAEKAEAPPELRLQDSSGGPSEASREAVRPSTRRTILLTFLAIAMLAASLWHLSEIDDRWPSSRSDLVPVWVGMRAIFAGQNPYSDATTLASQVTYYGHRLGAKDGIRNPMGFAYPAYTAVVLGWIAPLSWPAARLLVLILFAAMVATSVPLWIDVVALRLTRAEGALCVLFAMASWPVMWALRMQQLSIVVAACVALGCFLLKRNRNAAAGVVLALATIKPQLVALLLAWLVLWAFLNRRWKFLASLAAAEALLFAAAEWLSPGWVPRWVQAGNELLRYTHQVPALQDSFGKIAGGVLMAALAAITAVGLWRLRKTPADSADFGAAIALALGTTVALMPSFLFMNYNQMFLIPALLILLYRSRASFWRGMALTFAAWGFLSVMIFAVLELHWHSLVLITIPFWNPLFPAVVAGALALEVVQYKAPNRIGPFVVNRRPGAAAQAESVLG